MTDRLLSDRADKAFSFAHDTAKQLITLSAAIMTLTMTFLRDIAPANADTSWLEVSWVLYLSSIACGIVTLATLTGNLERPHEENRDSIYSLNIKIFAIPQAGLFLAGLAATTVFGLGAT
jgi:hypothetical protein